MIESLTVTGLYVGKPAALTDGKTTVTSAIRKAQVRAESVWLDVLNLDGDRQADLQSHGGADKAVYMYPGAHYAFWRSLGYQLDRGGVGENASVDAPEATQASNSLESPESAGNSRYSPEARIIEESPLLEGSVRIGDIWGWGEARVQVSQPRNPCFKLAMRSGRTSVTKDMITSSRCGWYLRVLREGPVPAAGTLELVERDPSAPTVEQLFLTSFARPGTFDPDALRRMVLTPALADQWRFGVLAKLQRLALGDR
jgi:MOSC domain-containing protein YiiM